MSTVPSTVPEGLHNTYRAANDLRARIKVIAMDANTLRHFAGTMKADPEAIANATIAYRCLEDASMRLGKVLQALDGGVSVYDKATTVGAPNEAAEEKLPWEVPPVNRTAEGAAIHADGASDEIPPVAEALESQRENNGAGEAGGLLCD